VHDNDGPGLWSDGFNEDLVYADNIVEDNRDNGIFHEISGAAVIRCNTVRRNGAYFDEWLWGSQIIVSTSDNVEIYGNLVEIGDTAGHGITIVNQQRGRQYSRNNYVHHNIIIYNALRGLCGAAADYDADNFWATGNNRFDYNTYYAPGSTGRLWHWSGGLADWNGFIAAGQEQNGIFHDDISSAPGQVSCKGDTVSIHGGYRDWSHSKNFLRRSQSRLYSLKGRLIKKAAPSFSASYGLKSLPQGVYLSIGNDSRAKMVPYIQ
jgi:hypothetical protein